MAPRKRFAAEADRPPGPAKIEQLPLPGDDLRLSETTKRFRVHVGDGVAREELRLEPLLNACAEFDIFDPTIRQLRDLVAVQWPGYHIRLAQLPKLPPTDPGDEVKLSQPAYGQR